MSGLYFAVFFLLYLYPRDKKLMIKILNKILDVKTGTQKKSLLNKLINLNYKKNRKGGFI